MAKRTSKERALRRKAMLRKWEPLEKTFAIHSSDELGSKLAEVEKDLKSEDNEMYANNRYTVQKETIPPERHGFGDIELTWLSIKANDDSARHDWREFQQIKNELCGPEREAIEVYPAESRLVDGANQFHLWVLPEGMGVPCGWWDRIVVEENTTEFGSQRPFEQGLRPDGIITEEEFHRKVSIAQRETGNRD